MWIYHQNYAVDLKKDMVNELKCSSIPALKCWQRQFVKWCYHTNIGLFLTSPAITCAPLRIRIGGGSVSFNQGVDGNGNYPFGTVATLTCLPMFSADGVSSSVCGDGTGTVGQFTPRLGTCIRK